MTLTDKSDQGVFLVVAYSVIDCNLSVHEPMYAVPLSHGQKKDNNLKVLYSFLQEETIKVQHIVCGTG